MNNSKLYNFIGFDLGNVGFFFELTGSTELFPRKEVIQPHLPSRKQSSSMKYSRSCRMRLSKTSPIMCP